MSTADLTQTTAPTWTPTLPEPEPKPTKPRNVRRILLGLLVAVLTVALGVVTFLVISQHSKAVDARSSLADTRDDLSDTEAYLKTAEADLADTESDLTLSEAALTSAQGTITAQDAQLADCALVTEISENQWEESDRMLDATSALTNGNLSEAGDKIDEAGEYIDAYIAIFDGSGYEYIDDLWAACSPDGSNA